jgi:hypothetical protein
MRYNNITSIAADFYHPGLTDFSFVFDIVLAVVDFLKGVGTLFRALVWNFQILILIFFILSSCDVPSAVRFKLNLYRFWSRIPLSILVFHLFMSSESLTSQFIMFVR